MSQCRHPSLILRAPLVLHVALPWWYNQEGPLRSVTFWKGRRVLLPSETSLGRRVAVLKELEAFAEAVRGWVRWTLGFASVETRGPIMARVPGGARPEQQSVPPGRPLRGSCSLGRIFPG